MNASCLNCSSPLTAAYRYCPQCGQDAHVHRLNAAHLMHDAVHFFTHADKGIFLLIKMLAIRPGHVAREYIQGMRRKYFGPLNFFLIVIGLFVFALSTFHIFEQRSSMTQAKAAVQKIPDPVARERQLAKLDRVEHALQFMDKYSNFVSMAATPLFAFIFFLSFSRRRYNFTEHLVAHLYFAGFNGLVFILIVAPLLSMVDNRQFYLTTILLYLLFGVIYRGIGYYQMMHKRGWRPFFHALAASLVASIVWYFISTSLVRLYISTGFTFS